jgi:hypothetical protein
MDASGDFFVCAAQLSGDQTPGRDHVPWKWNGACLGFCRDKKFISYEGRQVMNNQARIFFTYCREVSMQSL